MDFSQDDWGNKHLKGTQSLCKNEGFIHDVIFQALFIASQWELGNAN